MTNMCFGLTVVQFHGTSDTLADDDGNGAFVGAQANLANWGELNQLERCGSCTSFMIPSLAWQVLKVTRVRSGERGGCSRALVVGEL